MTLTSYTESYILAEIFAQLIESHTDYQARHVQGMGGTKICFEALRRGEIDLYPEYTGTIQEVMLKSPRTLTNQPPRPKGRGMTRKLLLDSPQAAGNQTPASTASVRGKAPSGSAGGGRKAPWGPRPFTGGRREPPKIEALRLGVQQGFHLSIGQPLGFNNTYAFAISSTLAKAQQLRTISDLAAHTNLRLGLSYEFLERQDGWGAVAKAYGLRPTSVRGMEHGLAYEAIANGAIDLTDAYSTDGKLEKFGLTILEDDRQFFPQYLAVPLLRNDALQRFPQLLPTLDRLAGRIDDATMRRMNAEAELDGKTFAGVAYDFLRAEGLLAKGAVVRQGRSIPTLIREHLFLTATALLAAILIGLPLGILTTRVEPLRKPVLALVGLLQTIPSFALLAFMIPLFGIGTVPAIIALFLYGLLPIVRNTYAGLREVAPVYIEVANGIGLTPFQRLRLIELPLASRVILAGIKTCAVISIGTATLAAFIGAGGLGEPILTGLALSDTRMIMRGAMPAALLALLTEYGFGALERICVPAGIRSS